MLKRSKNILFLIFTTTLAIVLSACSTFSTPSTETIINKTDDFSKNMKSVDFDINSTIETITSNNTEKTETKSKGSVITEPFASKTTFTISEDNKSQDTANISTLIKDDNLYIGINNSWVKSSNNDLLETYKSVKKVLYYENIYKFFKNHQKDFKLNTENNNYVLTYSANEPDAKDLFLTMVKASSPYLESIDGLGTDSFNSLKFKDVNIKFVTSKNYEPLEINIDLTVAGDSNSTMKVSQKITYSNFNNVADIQVPDSAKNSTTFGGNNNNS